MRDGMNNLKKDFSQTAQQIASSPCPQSGNCVSTTVLVSLLLVQLIILISFMVYRDGKEKAAKKYYWKVSQPEFSTFLFPTIFFKTKTYAATWPAASVLWCLSLKWSTSREKSPF